MKKHETQEFLDFIIDTRRKVTALLIENNQQVRISNEQTIERLESGEIFANYETAHTYFRMYRAFLSEFGQAEPLAPKWLATR